jgi:glucose-1-phosphate thymidylyltransferase
MPAQGQVKIIGFIPVGGSRRLSPLPCRKEIYPIGFRDSHVKFEKRPKVVCHYLLEKMRLADISQYVRYP